MKKNCASSWLFTKTMLSTLKNVGSGKGRGKGWDGEGKGAGEGEAHRTCSYIGCPTTYQTPAFL